VRPLIQPYKPPPPVDDRDDKIARQSDEIDNLRSQLNQMRIALLALGGVALLFMIIVATG